jgi:glycosyltransferase involved in cell wall biosynthesis
MTVLEAYALGKPVIGADIGGIPELILENETGFSFRSGDAHALAAALQRMNSISADDIETLGRRARGWVSEHFNAEVYRQRVLGVYDELGVSRSKSITALAS